MSSYRVSRISHSQRRLLREERGFTLPEMMVTMMLMIVVLFALYSIFDMSLRVFSFSNNKVEAVEQARVGLERMEREIRAAYPYNKGATPPDTRVLETMARSEITFGNDTSGNYVVETSEKISYKLLQNSSGASCDPGDECRVYRSVGGGGWDRLVEFVPAPNPSASPPYEGGLRFTYLNASGAQTNVEADVRAVRIELDVIVNQGRDQGKQTLVTDVALRNRGE